MEIFVSLYFCIQCMWLSEIGLWLAILLPTVVAEIDKPTLLWITRQKYRSPDYFSFLDFEF